MQPVKLNDVSVEVVNDERIVKHAGRIIGDDTEGLHKLVQTSLMNKFNCILSDNTHPLNPLIAINKSGRIRQINLKTNRFKKFFFTQCHIQF